MLPKKFLEKHDEEETERKDRMDIYFMRSNAGKIFGILTLQVYRILQLPCSDLVVDSLLKFALTITQMDASAAVCWLGLWGWGGR